jgi:hypothetical protein
MKIVAKACVSLLALVACALVLVEAFHFVKYRHLAPLGLHADFTMRHADLGIEASRKLTALSSPTTAFVRQQ